MGMWERFKLIFKSKANKALDKAENPAETLDYSYEKQLTCCRRSGGVADVATSRKRLELQIKSPRRSRPSWRIKPARRSPWAARTWPGRRSPVAAA